MVVPHQELVENSSSWSSKKRTNAAAVYRSETLIARIVTQQRKAEIKQKCKNRDRFVRSLLVSSQIDIS